MYYSSLGFIGGGRITKIFLERLDKEGKLTKDVMVSDNNDAVLKNIHGKFPAIKVELNGNLKVAEQQIIFISLHPPVLLGVLEEIKSSLKQNSIIVSLAPKISSLKISELLNGFNRIIRMIPNSPSIIGEGYNPVWISPSLSENEKIKLISLFRLFGETPEVEEKMLEAYAVIAAMGPTYFQFQFEHISDIAHSLGFSESASKDVVAKMLAGSLKLWTNESYSYNEVYDLIPVKPFGNDEDVIKKIFSEKLIAIYDKIKTTN